MANSPQKPFSRKLVLTVSKDGQRLTTKSFESGPVVLGRQPGCDIVLEFGFISRTHCQIIEEEGQFWVVDLGSRNGFVVAEEHQTKASFSEEISFEIQDLKIQAVLTVVLDKPAEVSGQAAMETVIIQRVPKKARSAALPASAPKIPDAPKKGDTESMSVAPVAALPPRPPTAEVLEPENTATIEIPAVSFQDWSSFRSTVPMWFKFALRSPEAPKIAVVAASLVVLVALWSASDDPTQTPAMPSQIASAPSESEALSDAGFGNEPPALVESELPRQQVVEELPPPMEMSLPDEFVPTPKVVKKRKAMPAPQKQKAPQTIARTRMKKEAPRTLPAKKIARNQVQKPLPTARFPQPVRRYTPPPMRKEAVRVGGRSDSSSGGVQIELRRDPRKRTRAVAAIMGALQISVEPGGLNRDQIGREMQKTVPRIQRCYQTGLAKKPDLRGRMKFQVQVTASGNVSQVSMKNSSVSDAALSQCVKEVLRSSRYPKSKSSTKSQVEIPFGAS